MSTGRFVAPGRTRSCPHCKATILDSATVCPGCHHHLRFDSASVRAQESDTPLRVDGIVRHPANGEAWEYSVVLAIRNARGEEISRQVVGVGALQPDEERTFSLAVEVFKPVAVAKPVEAAKASDTVRPSLPSKPGIAPRPAAAATAPSPTGAAPSAATSVSRPVVAGAPGPAAAALRPAASPTSAPTSAAPLKPAGAPSNPAGPAKLGAAPAPRRPTDGGATSAQVAPGFGRRWLPGGAERDPKR
jgi:hypothetical protein